MTRQRTRPSHSAAGDVPPEFFKVYLARFSSHHLKIPPAFVKYCVRNLPERALLKDVNGRAWDVGLDRADDGMFIRDGWEKFVDDAALSEGEFLIFTYDQDDLTFVVKRYGIHGCRKDVCLASNKEIVCVNLKDVEEDAGDHELAPCTDGSGGSIRNLRPLKSRLRISGNKAVAAKGDLAWSEASGRIVSNCLHLSKTMAKSNKLKLNLDGKLLKKHNIQMHPTVKLYIGGLSKWTTKFVTSKDGRLYLGSGWTHFYHENDLKAGDECDFEFVLDNRMRARICKQIRVQIRHI
uniref:TF-B3 domain-containing protein n=1 Tax=Kalanchoe fedtschenkoi TaxID=63787 RepID=A0A7N0T9L3_KALFE